MDLKPKKGIEKASQPQYGVIVEENVFVTARDGVKLAVDVYRPDAPGKFPALLALSPYGKSAQVFQTPPQPFGKSIFEASIESGDPYFYVPRGYVFVIGDLRGTGDSEGECEGHLSRYEGQDGADIVEWIAEQPWCDGNVGGAGICYFATMQLHVAAEQPPHLKCIAPWEIYGDDLYNHGAYEGGVLNIFFYGLYTGTYPARCGYAIKNVVSAMIKNTPKAEMEKLVEKAISNPDLVQYPYLYHLLKYPQKNPILFDFMLNPLDGSFYRERSVIERIDKIKVPAYVGGPFFSFFTEPQVNVFNRLQVPKKMFLYTDMGMRPWRAYHDELLRWYDYWLKGIDTGIMDEEPIRYHITGAEKWSTAKEWPLENTVWTDFYLGSLGQLQAEPDYFNPHPDCFLQEPLFVSEERAHVTYVSPPLAEDLQVTGPPRITFFASVDTDDTNFRIQVREAGSDALYPLAQGWLKASHRALDEAKTTPWEIAHDHTKAVPVKPGEIYEYTVQLRPMSHLFKAGSRILLDISSIDVPTDPETYDVMWHVCNARATLHKIYRDGKHPSRLSLPVIPRKG
ncbi:MAG: CocE/NonD family hydrolase [Peptococcaceae bacterium]|nr:CocE/NonD family hydrolase [Peptococcaceae bacterium]